MNPPTRVPVRPAPNAGGGWNPQPQRIKHRRTGGDVLKGVGAFLALVVLLGAIPFALVWFIGWPLPHHLPSAQMFNRPITPPLLLKALAVIVWLAWAQFAACVVVELVAAVRGIGMPARVPGAGPSQFLARQLIAALLMITASAASFVPNLAHLGADPAPASQHPTTATAARLPGPQQYQPAAIAAPGRGYPATGAMVAAVNPRSQSPASVGNLPAVRGESGLRVAGNSLAPASLASTKLYRVQPPHGRHHDTLWEIAQRHLGDGRRYKEIFELNKERVQPDGSQLTHASLIRPGWILMMPADAIGGDLVVEPAPIGTDNLSPAQSGGIQVQPGASSPGGSAVQPAPHALPAQTAYSLGGAGGAGGAGAVGAAGSVSAAGSRTAPSALTPVPPTAKRPPVDQSAEELAKIAGAAAAAAASDPAVSDPAAPSSAASDPAASTSVAALAAPVSPAPVAPASVAPAPVTPSCADPASVAANPAEDAAPAVAAPAPAQEPVTSREAPEQGAADQGAAGQHAGELTADGEKPAGPQTAESALAAPISRAPARAQIALSGPSSAAAPAAAAATDTAAASAIAAAATAANQGAVTAGGVNPGAGRPSHRGVHSPEESQPPSTENRVLYGLAAAPLLAAGLLKALGRHRRRQLFNRVFGRRPVTAAGDAAVAEESIRVGASEVEVWFLDLALRGLSAGLAERGRSVPGAYAVRLRNEGIELLLNQPMDPEDPGSQPPAPWLSAADGRSWNFPRPGIVDVDAQAAHRRFAPYPGLVTLGALPAGGEPGRDRLMIDLEEARGLIGLDGPPEVRRAVLASLAVELATNSWSDRMTVTLVGFPGDLAPLAPARVRHVRTLDEILPSLEIEAAERAKALAAAGLGSVLDGRCRASQASSFPPHFVLVSEGPHAAILARLSAVATTAARVGLGFLVAGEPVGASWQLTVRSDGRIAAPQLGIEAQAQLLPEEQYAAVLGLFRAVCDVDGTELPAGPVHQSVGYGGPLPDEPPAVYAALLGQVVVTGAGQIEPQRAALLHEALVFLLHHRDGVHPRVLAAALWPRGATADVAEATFARLATWLGDDPNGQPNLHTDADGRLRLGPYVWSDWDMFVSLQSRALYDAAIRDQQHRDELFKAALDLVRGPYLADREPNRYGWLAYEVTEAQVPAVIADAALRLADSCVASGKAEAAIEAVKAGMLGSPDDEELWRGLLRATAATGETERLRGAIEGLYKRTWYVHGVQGLHPRTEALVNELMPDWREIVAV